jgi:hypothetical protein
MSDYKEELEYRCCLPDAARTTVFVHLFLADGFWRVSNPLRIRTFNNHVAARAAYDKGVNDVIQFSHLLEARLRTLYRRSLATVENEGGKGREKKAIRVKAR